MSSEIWKIGQETNAQAMFKDINEKGINGCRFLKGEVLAVKQLTAMCNKMTEAYDEVINDQNEYLLEIEAEDIKLQSLQEDVNDKIEKLLTEIKALEKKEQDGSITEDEQKELDAKKGELNTYMSSSSSEIKEKSEKLAVTGEAKISEHKSKEDIAKNYGEVTVEKGTPLAETEVKGGFFRKLFGTTGKDKKEAGEKAVEAGNNLLNKVGESVDISTEINSHYKNIKKK